MQLKKKVVLKTQFVDDKRRGALKFVLKSFLSTP